MENKNVNVLGEKYSIMFVDEYPERFSDFEESADAFLFESGLSSNTHGIYGAWAENEEMVDWIAIQSPKIFKVFQELEIL